MQPSWGGGVYTWASLCNRGGVFTPPHQRFCHPPKSSPPPTLAEGKCGQTWSQQRNLSYPTYSQSWFSGQLLMAFFVETFFSLRLVYFLDLRELDNCVTLSHWVPLCGLTHSPKFQSGDIFREGQASVFTASLYNFAIMDKMSFVTIFKPLAITFQSLTTQRLKGPIKIIQSFS